MIESGDKTRVNKLKEYQSPQCQYFVVRKKRLCRMTVRPGRQYCGEHEPKPKTEDGQDDTRIPCPNDPKHTCYASKLEKHLTICNARQEELPPYVELNINAPEEDEPPLQVSLSDISSEKMALLIDKVNKLYDTHLKGEIETFEDQEIHETILANFQEEGRGEKSLRHLRQANSLLRLAERERLVRPHTCYVELGAGKGHLSYYAWQAWCGALEQDSCVLLVDRASLRHKRDNKLRSQHEAASVARVRADLAHLRLAQAPGVARSRRLVAMAKHLCGVATDYALRCVTAASLGDKLRGVVLATCCHHRCRRDQLLGAHTLQELGISAEELELMLRMVSWATCGDGRSRERRRKDLPDAQPDVQPDAKTDAQPDVQPDAQPDVQPDSQPDAQPDVQLAARAGPPEQGHCNTDHGDSQEPLSEHQHDEESDLILEDGCRVPGACGRRAALGFRCKALMDWARVQWLRRRGLRARQVRFVPASVTPENLCIVASRPE